MDFDSKFLRSDFLKLSKTVPFPGLLFLTSRSLAIISSMFMSASPIVSPLPKVSFSLKMSLWCLSRSSLKSRLKSNLGFFVTRLRARADWLGGAPTANQRAGSPAYSPETKFSVQMVLADFGSALNFCEAEKFKLWTFFRRVKRGRVAVSSGWRGELGTVSSRQRLAVKYSEAAE